MFRFLIADDHAIVIQGIGNLLQGQYPSAKIVQVYNAEDLIEKTMKEEWDLVITDFNMPGRNGLDALKQIREIHPRLPVLIMSMYAESQFGLRAIKAGASGYLGKETIHEELLKAVSTVLNGRRYITPVIAEQLADNLKDDNPKELYELLSDREFNVFKLLAEGKTPTDIAKQLMVSPTTISTFRSRIMDKLKMKSNSDLTRYALEKKLI
ncbi:MAG: response regulator transcription factor, partial [Bacteroidota bacterium]